MQVFLIRHPQPAMDASVCYGHTDMALDANALFSLPSLAISLREQVPGNIPLFSSPLLRCRLLAEALHTQPLYDDRLKEMHFGEWESQPWSGIPRHQLDQWAANPLHYAIPGGESVAQMQARVLHFIQEQLLQQQAQGTKQMAIVTHAGVMKILFAQARGLPLNEWMSLHFDYGSLQVVNLP